MEIGISFHSLLFFSRLCRLKKHSQKTQWEWRHFKITAQLREGGAGEWKSKLLLFRHFIRISDFFWIFPDIKISNQSALCSRSRTFKYLSLVLIRVKKSYSWQKWLNWQCWAALKKDPFLSLLFFQEVIMAFFICSMLT